jgi:basic membrane protein A and related proteins
MRFSVTLIVGAGLLFAAGAAANPGVPLDGPPKPAFVYAGAIDDQGWNQAIDQARSKMQETLNLKIPYADNVPAEGGGVTSSTENFIGQGYNIIIGDSAVYADAFKAMAQKHPGTVFINLQDVKAPSGQPNFQSVYGRSYESQYLCGVATGLATKSGNIGFLASQPTSVANWEINAYTLGVKLNKPDATVHVIFIGAQDPAKERAAASALIDHGADVLGQSLDGPTPQVVAEERGVLATGHAVDLHDLAPKSTICSSIWTWDRYLVRDIKKIAAANWTADQNSGLVGMIEGSNDIACCSDVAPIKTIAKIIAERDGIIITQNQVFKGPLDDNEGKERVKEGDYLSDDDLWAMNWYVKGVTIDK